MPLLEDLLLRFRRVWAPPGPVAGQAGVPEDPTAHIDDELRDLSAALKAIELNGQELLRAAQAEADSIVDSARTEASRIVGEARNQVPQARATHAAQRVNERQIEIDQLVTAAEGRAEDIRSGASSRMQQLIDKVVAQVFLGTDSQEVADARVMGGG